MTLSEILAQHVAVTTFESLPKEAITAAKRLLIDTLAVAWAGSDAPGVPSVRDLLAQESVVQDAFLWGTRDRASSMGAAFANSAAAAALDYDSLHLEAVVHPELVCLPAVLATAEHHRVDGKALLTAAVLATDLACRLGLSTNAHSGWFYTSVHGGFAAACGCAKLLRLSPGSIRDALGITLSQTAGSQQAMVEKSLLKRIQAAFASRAGIFSAYLAQSGVTAPHEAFEGKFGFYNLYEHGDPKIVTADLGERLESVRTTIKKYPSCGCNHAIIDATLALIREHRLSSSDVSAARVMISPYMERLVGGVYEPGMNPQVAAQFSAQYSVACALSRGRLGLAEISPSVATDSSLVAFARRVEISVDQENSGHFVPASVELITHSGEHLTHRVSAFPGSPESPISDSELMDKIRECMAQGTHPLTPSQIERITSWVDELERISDVSTLMAVVYDD